MHKHLQYRRRVPSRRPHALLAQSRALGTFTRTPVGIPNLRNDQHRRDAYRKEGGSVVPSRRQEGCSEMLDVITVKGNKEVNVTGEF
jgi:hypothetical protein